MIVRARIVTLTLDGSSVEVSTTLSQAIVSASPEPDPNERAILAAIDDVPDEAVGWRGATPGPHWERVRRAVAAARGLPTRFEDEAPQ